MAKKRALMLDSDGDLLMSSGLQIGSVTVQNQALILALRKGELKNNPALGVAIEDMIGDDDVLSWKWIIRNEFARDDINVNNITTSSLGQLIIEAEYK